MSESLSELIRRIYSDSSLSAAEKSARAQSLLSNRVTTTPHNTTSTQELVSYHSHGILGCMHYSRKCQIKASCCGCWFVCRRCHDEHVHDHAIDRFATKEMRCMLCGREQPVGKTCTDCGEEMAKYYCAVCKFFDDSAEINVYHCHECGLCRRGKGIGIDFIHCERCKACLPIQGFNQHVCIDNLLESPCPICLEWMHNSVVPAVFLKCGHPMHSNCYEKFVRSAFQCPTCLKAHGDTEALDRVVEEYVNSIEVPEHYQNHKALILCNECLNKNEVAYHFVHHKCPDCKSFNTDVLKVIKPN